MNTSQRSGISRVPVHITNLKTLPLLHLNSRLFHPTPTRSALFCCMCCCLQGWEWQVKWRKFQFSHLINYIFAFEMKKTFWQINNICSQLGVTWRHSSRTRSTAQNNNIFMPLMLIVSAVRHYLRTSLALILTYCQQTSVVNLMYSTDTILHKNIYYCSYFIKNLPWQKVSYNKYNCISEWHLYGKSRYFLLADEEFLVNKVWFEVPTR